MVDVVTRVQWHAHMALSPRLTQFLDETIFKARDVSYKMIKSFYKFCAAGGAYKIRQGQKGAGSTANAKQVSPAPLRTLNTRPFLANLKSMQLFTGIAAIGASEHRPHSRTALLHAGVGGVQREVAPAARWGGGGRG